MTTLTTHRPKARRLVAAVLTCCAVNAVAAPAANAEFGVVPGSFHADTIREFPPPPVPPDPPGDPVLEDRAGVAPNGAVVGFDLNRLPDLQPPFMVPVPDGAATRRRCQPARSASCARSRWAAPPQATSGRPM